MIEVEKGIFRFDGELNTREKTLILVHPWFPIHYEEPYEVFPVGFLGFFGFNKPGYLKNLEKLLSLHKGNKFVFEENSRVQETAEKIALLSGRREGLYLTATFDDDKASSVPLNTDYKSIANLLRRFGKKLIFAGGYIYDRNMDNRGCLGGVYDSLKETGFAVKLLRGGCVSLVGDD